MRNRAGYGIPALRFPPEWSPEMADHGEAPTPMCGYADRSYASATAAVSLWLPKVPGRAASIVPTLPERDRTVTDVCVQQRR
jgi:hypothetical protein